MITSNQLHKVNKKTPTRQEEDGNKNAEVPNNIEATHKIAIAPTDNVEDSASRLINETLAREGKKGRRYKHKHGLWKKQKQEKLHQQ